MGPMHDSHQSGGGGGLALNITKCGTSNVTYAYKTAADENNLKFNLPRLTTPHDDQTAMASATTVVAHRYNK
jgi:hypothetical protein